MEAVTFEQCNVIYAENQPEYSPLPAYREPGAEGRIITCFKLTPDELNKVAETGVIWVSILTFNKPLQPLLPQVDNPFKG